MERKLDACIFIPLEKGFPSLLPSLLQTKIWSLQRPINVLVCYLTHTLHIANTSLNWQISSVRNYMYIIRPYLSFSVSETYLHAIVFSTVSFGLPTWSLSTKEITAPIARLYYRALKIQVIYQSLPKWSHHCIALAHTNALTSQNFINSHAIAFYFRILNSTSPTFTALLPTRDVWQVHLTRSISQALIPVPAFRNGYGQRLFFIPSLKFGTPSLITSEYQDLSEPSRRHTDCTFPTVITCTHWLLHLLFM